MHVFNGYDSIKALSHNCLLAHMQPALVVLAFCYMNAHISYLFHEKLLINSKSLYATT